MKARSSVRAGTFVTSPLGFLASSPLGAVPVEKRR